jgi:hypothetical protein
VIVWCAAILLPWFLAALSYDEEEAEMGIKSWLTFWRGFPFHFVTAFEYGDEFRIFSVAYLADMLFWAFLFLALRRGFLHFRNSWAQAIANEKASNV